MRLISFDPFRTLGIPGATYLKPAAMWRHRDLIEAADWVLFPEYWQVNALHYGLRKRIFPSVASYHLGHDKIEMSRVLQARFAAHLPETLILPATRGSVDQVLDTLSLPLVCKRVRSSMGEGVVQIHTAGELYRYIEREPVLYAQEYLPIDRDLRIVVVGNRIIASYWRIAAAGSFLNNVARGASTSFEAIPESAVNLVHAVAHDLQIDHAGFDIAVVDGHPYLLEFNVLFGNETLNQQGIRPATHILDYLQSRHAPQDTPPGRPPRPQPRLPLAS